MVIIIGNVISVNLDYCCLSLVFATIKSNHPTLPDAVTNIPCGVCWGENTMLEEKDNIKLYRLLFYLTNIVCYTLLVYVLYQSSPPS